MDQMAIAFPFSDPVAIHIYGQFGIRWYGLAYTAGLLLGWFYMRRLCRETRGFGAGMRRCSPIRWTISCFGRRSAPCSAAGSGFFLFYEPQYC